MGLWWVFRSWIFSSFIGKDFRREPYLKQSCITIFDELGLPGTIQIVRGSAVICTVLLRTTHT